MKTSVSGIAVMHYFERCVLHAYPDPASQLGRALQREGLWQRVLQGAPVPDRLACRLSGAPWTIGWGDTGPSVRQGLTITQDEADQRFARRLAREFEPGVEKLLQVNVTQGQFDALVSFSYNLGTDALASSTLLRLLNRGNPTGAAQQFSRWVNAGGQPMLGLKRRRAAEVVLWNGGTGAAAIEAAKTVTV